MNPRLEALYKNFKTKLEDFKLQVTRGSKSLITTYIYITKCMLILSKYYKDINELDLNAYIKTDDSFYFDDNIALLQHREKIYYIISKRGLTLIGNSTDFKTIDIPFNIVFNVNKEDSYISYNVRDFDVEKIPLKLNTKNNIGFVNKIKINFDKYLKNLGY